MDNKHIQHLIGELDETFTKLHNLLARILTPTSQETTATVSDSRPSGEITPQFSRTARLSSDATGPSTGRSTVLSPDDNGGDYLEQLPEDNNIHVQTPLEPETYDENGLRSHLRSYPWPHHARGILEGVVGNLSRIGHALIPRHTEKLQDRSHSFLHSVHEIGNDGAPLLVDKTGGEQASGAAMAIWAAIKEINPPEQQRKAVGRITTFREPSPIFFAAAHFTMHKHFDMDELFRRLWESDGSSASAYRAFEADPRRQRSVVFNLEYFTLIDPECEPMKWQMAEGQVDRTRPDRVAITRCSSVIAVALNGPVVHKPRNRSRQRIQDYGFVYDPFSSYQVVNVQCYPDFKATLNVHDESDRYVNGPEAFMHCLLAELGDAEKRMNDVCTRIAARVTPPLEFMFDADIRERLLFEDGKFSMARLYHWAHRTLGIMTASVENLVDAYEATFTEEVWRGDHKMLWPMMDPDSARSKEYKRKMGILKEEFGTQLIKLRKIIDKNQVRRTEIIGLRDELFTGTSIFESRKSVEATVTTVQQGHNIKLLTLVSMSFLPLTFCSGIFGMSMRKDFEYWQFAIVTSTVCVPFILLIGSLNTHRGMTFWREKTHMIINKTILFFAWLAGLTKQKPRPVDPELGLSETATEDGANDTGREDALSPLEPSHSTPVRPSTTRNRQRSSRSIDNRDRVAAGRDLRMRQYPSYGSSPPTSRRGTETAVARRGDGSPATQGAQVTDTQRVSPREADRDPGPSRIADMILRESERKNATA